MSMILDALRKSEEQRRLGAQPDIHNAPGESPPDASEPLRQWLPVSLIVVSALVMAWFGWQQFRPPSDIPTTPPVSVQVPAAEPAEPPAQSAAGEPRTPVEAYSAPQQSVPESADDEERPAATGEPAASLKDVSEFEAPPPAAAAQTAAAQTEPQRAAEPGPEPEPKVAGDEPYQPDAMSYWELPQGVRDSLPQFRISVIVYADDPADRFVLVNGIRLREKDELQSGVVLEEIRRGGAVFRARNYRFLVKG
jgi:general secretion pathway protein B